MFLHSMDSKMSKQNIFLFLKSLFETDHLAGNERSL
jgi:hypothetical protein